jgi:predicted secreted hydrolase
MRLAFAVLLAVALFVGAWVIHKPDRAAPAGAPTFSVARALSGDTQGFARADTPRPFVFPADHGPHPAFKQEWWYYTGNLETPDHRHFGFQLTFFRIALAANAPPRRSHWESNQVYMAHFTLSDVGRGRFYQFQRFSRAGLELAGARAAPFKVWLEDWQATQAPGPSFVVRLQAKQDEIAIDLTLQPSKALVLEGDRGLSQKSSGPGNASYYYSFTRLATDGRVQIGATAFAVAGTSWMDREWSTSALAPDQAGWDWFALQLANGDDIMFYRLRRRDGSADPHSGGVLVTQQGVVTRLSLANIALDIRDHWRSPHTGTRYPAKWRLELRSPHEGLRLDIAPYLADQELRGAVHYWEGAVSVHGEAQGRPITGRGYVELTGYEGDRQ